MPRGKDTLTNPLDRERARRAIDMQLALLRSRMDQLQGKPLTDVRRREVELLINQALDFRVALLGTKEPLPPPT